MRSILIFDNVYLSFGDNKVLSGFSLEVKPNERISIIGASSSGKSTLLKLITGLLKPDNGKIIVFEQDLTKISHNDLIKLRKKISFQFQAGAMFDNLTVIENLLFAMNITEKGDIAKQQKKAQHFLTQVGLKRAQNQYPFSLSGGMRKRAAIARALATNPKLALFDEPAAGLDPVSSRQIVSLIANMAIENETASIIATTDVQAAQSFATRLVIINQGKNWANGTLSELQKSEDLLVKQLLSRII